MVNEASVRSPQPRRTRSEIEQIVKQFAESGLNRSEFCRRHGLCPGTLNRHLQRIGASNAASSDGLVAVELVGNEFSSDRKGGGGVTVVLSRERRIEVSAGFDTPTLQRLIALLENM